MPIIAIYIKRDHWEKELGAKIGRFSSKTRNGAVFWRVLNHETILISSRQLEVLRSPAPVTEMT